jgi:hypothetical protein
MLHTFGTRGNTNPQKPFFNFFCQTKQNLSCHLYQYVSLAISLSLSHTHTPTHTHTQIILFLTSATNWMKHHIVSLQT